MKSADTHLSDRQLLLDLDGELSTRDARPVRAHLDACWQCRARRHELDRSIAGFVRAHRERFEPEIPSADGPRALLKARLTQLTPAERRWSSVTRGAAAVFAALVLGVALTRLNRVRPNMIVSAPDARLTPGATIRVGRPSVCAQAAPGNKTVPIALQRRVFQEYGIPGADPKAYEVDYLVTPALGGADDIHNLWPHSYSAVWNARVKDALEDRLRDMVCDGSLDLTEAQGEIATDWISAYKKYFHTDEPLAEHRR